MVAHPVLIVVQGEQYFEENGRFVHAWQVWHCQNV